MNNIELKCITSSILERVTNGTTESLVIINGYITSSRGQ